MCLNIKRFACALTAFALGCITAIPTAAAAQTAEPETAPNSSPHTLPKVTVSADEESYKAESSASLKTDAPLRDTPQSISVVTRKLMDDQNMQNIADVVRYVPGIGMAQGEGNRDTPVFRGSSSTADFYVDGIRDDIQYYRDLYNIEQVEALKGPNGMLFGRGGVGGVINRVTKQAGWEPVRGFTVQGGTDSNKRTTIDFGQPFSDSVAFRINGVYEDSDSFRDDVNLERYGVNPTLTIRAGENTQLAVGVEYFKDNRVADRGISSFNGRPVDTDPSTFFGDPEQSFVRAEVKAASALIEHYFSEQVTLRNRTRYADYDKIYQNVFPGAVNAAGTEVSISAYNNAMQRENIFNQTDLVFSLGTGAVTHDLLAGVELGRQVTDNFRNTGFFDSVAFGTTSVNVPLGDPRTTLPVTFRQSATDADNHGTAKVAAAYLQDQMHLSEHFQLIVGVRYDDFQVDFTNNRTATDFSTDDGLVSPRAGLVYKPSEPLSFYASYSMSSQPRAGEQLASLSLTNQALDPEEFKNREVGVKWDFLPTVSLTAAIYQLDRSNVAITDPSNPTALILVDGQRVKGAELGVSGNITAAWSIMGAYAYQDGDIVSDQSATVRKGASLANLPYNSVSLWNRYDFSPTWGVGLGVIYRDSMLAATENVVTPAANVTLPGYTRMDAAVFFRLNENLRAQLNVENLLDEEYFATANSNTNITPGSPRAARISLLASF
jgi:catecholate siderophore receptor